MDLFVGKYTHVKLKALWSRIKWPHPPQ